MEMEVHQVIQDIIRSFCRIATTMIMIFRVQKQAVLLPGDLRYHFVVQTYPLIAIHSYTHIPMAGLILIMPSWIRSLDVASKSLWTSPGEVWPSVNGCFWIFWPVGGCGQLVSVRLLRSCLFFAYCDKYRESANNDQEWSRNKGYIRVQSNNFTTAPKSGGVLLLFWELTDCSVLNRVSTGPTKGSSGIKWFILFKRGPSIHRKTHVTCEGNLWKTGQ